MCEEQQTGWQQTAPLPGSVPPPAGETLADCAPFAVANGLTLGPRGYNFSGGANEVRLNNDFGLRVNGAPGPGSIRGLSFNDLNGNRVHDAGEPALDGQIHVFGTPNLGAALHLVTFTDSDGSYRFVLEPGTYTVCEAFESTGPQTAPLAAPPPSGLTLADCTQRTDDDGNLIVLGPRGYHFTLAEGTSLEGANFGNIVPLPPPPGIIRGVKFNDLNGNGVRDPGEPGLPNRQIHLVKNDFVPQPRPGPPILATIRVDRHSRHDPPGGIATTTGGQASIVLTLGSRTAKADFDVGIQFILGCRPGITKEQELEGAAAGGGFYIPISRYGLPKDLLPGLFEQLGVTIDPTAYIPIITAVTKRKCVDDPNPANNGVDNHGILVVKAEIGFESREVHEVVVATATTDASGKYKFRRSSGS